MRLRIFPLAILLALILASPALTTSAVTANCGADCGDSVVICEGDSCQATDGVGCAGENEDGDLVDVGSCLTGSSLVAVGVSDPENALFESVQVDETEALAVCSADCDDGTTVVCEDGDSCKASDGVGCSAEQDGELVDVGAC